MPQATRIPTNSRAEQRPPLIRGVRATAQSRAAVLSMGLDPMLRMPDAEALTGLGASMIYQMMHDGTFPKSIPLTPNGRARGWRLSTVNEWLEARALQDRI